MKRTRTYLIQAAFIIGFIGFGSCKADSILNVCTTCTEASTSVSQDYCGNLAAVETFETTLKNTSGQSWSCVRN